MSGSVARQHAEWLALVEVSGPFLTLPVLQRALPQGVDPVEPELADRLRHAYEEWQLDPDLHGVWIRWVLEEVLGFDERSLREGPGIPPGLSFTAPEHGEELRPDLAVLDPEDGKARMLVTTWPEEVPLEERLSQRRWVATPLDQMAELLRGTGVRLGLVTNGDRWTLVHVPARGAVTFARWEAALWIEERITLAAFRTLLGVERLFAVADEDRLEALFAESANAEQEVTDQLGRQVRAAVELLVDAFGRADREQAGELLNRIGEEDLLAAGVATREELLYRAAVTVMMRLVFLLSAEERKLLPIDDDLYGQCYAISTLRAQLQEEADRYGEEPLERRSSAWCRLLATFRMVHGGVRHEDLHLPPYGGALFDPDRFPFLEGRKPGEPWVDTPGRPLPVDDRTVLHMLDALQVLRFRGRGGVTEARRVSFRALDVEQIGHVYEGLLDHMAVTVTDPALGFRGSKEAEIALEEVERRAHTDRARFISWLSEETGLSEKAVEKALSVELRPEERAKLLAACGNDQSLAERVAPFHALLRRDLRDLPQVYLAGSVYVTKTSERRTSGTYYTPRSLAEEMVRHALEPLVYHPGPAEGASPEEWKLRPPADLLDIKICDMAMGSGAFLVAACRYLADRLVEAWETLGEDGTFTVEGHPAQGDAALVVPPDPGDRVVLARRLVADRCLYGVDKNPIAVEMAKLSLWLVTLAKDRPFSFLDHALKAGDSLLGIHDLSQLEHLHLDPERGKRLHITLGEHWHAWQGAVKQAIERRRELESFTVLSVADADLKAELFEESEAAMAALKVVGDAVVGAGLSTATQRSEALDATLLELAPDVAKALDSARKEHDRLARLEDLRVRAIYALNQGRPPVQPDRLTFHWPLEFPEVFVDRGGFDAIVGNPPFQGGKKISGAHGTDYREYLVHHIAAGKKGNADLIAYFFLRAAQLLREGGVVAMLATNTVAQGDTREVGLDQLAQGPYSIIRAWKSRPWPGDASLEVSQVWLRRGDWEGTAVLDGESVPGITSSLDARTRVVGVAHRLQANSGLSFIGSLLNGIGFVLDADEAEALLSQDPRNHRVIFPYLNGEDLNSAPDLRPRRLVINFFDWSLDEAGNYPLCLARVRERVKPQRERLPDSKRRVREHWWQFEHIAPALYEAVGSLSRVIALAETSKTIMPAFVPTDIVFSHMVVVFAYDDDAHLGILSSAFHWWWAVTRASTLETRIRYTPTDVFETFPQPEPTDQIASVAKALDDHRRAMMRERWEGLTKTYNRVHDPEEKAADVARLRELHVQLDHAVAIAYGWSDLNLDHGFHETPQGRRFTVAPATRVEILDRLLEVNHERHREEVAAGLHAGRSRHRKVRPAAADQGRFGLG